MDFGRERLKRLNRRHLDERILDLVISHDLCLKRLNRRHLDERSSEILISGLASLKRLNRRHLDELPIWAMPRRGTS